MTFGRGGCGSSLHRRIDGFWWRFKLCESDASASAFMLTCSSYNIHRKLIRLHSDTYYSMGKYRNAFQWVQQQICPLDCAHTHTRPHKCFMSQGSDKVVDKHEYLSPFGNMPKSPMFGPQQNSNCLCVQDKSGEWPTAREADWRWRPQKCAVLANSSPAPSDTKAEASCAFESRSSCIAAVLSVFALDGVQGSETEMCPQTQRGGD